MTGAEMLQTILDGMNELKIIVEDLRISIKLIEGNIKILNNRAAVLIKQDADIPQIQAVLPSQAVTIPLPQTRPMLNQITSRTRQINNDVQAKQIKPLEEKMGTKTYKKVFGKLIDGGKEPIESVVIKIYDKNNEVCAATESDPTGYWTSMLTPGRYVAEYIKPGFKASNKTFEVKKNDKEIEVR